MDRRGRHPDAEYFARFLRLAPYEWGLVSSAGIGDLLLVAGLARAFADRHHADAVSLVVPNRIIDAAAGYRDSFTRIIGVDHIPTAALHAPPTFAPGIPFIAEVYSGLGGALIPFLGHRGLTLLDAYRLLLRLAPDTPMLPPSRQPTAEAEAERLVDRLGLPRGRTVLLAPAAATLRPLPTAVWEALAGALQARGWTVCLNAPCPAGQRPAGVEPVEISLRLLAAVAERLGWVIATRTGLCDLLAFSRCHLTVLYGADIGPKLAPLLPRLGGIEERIERLFAASSLHRMGLPADATELLLPSAKGAVQAILADAPALAD